MNKMLQMYSNVLLCKKNQYAGSLAFVTTVDANATDRL
uniref:Uncharacterized protein n=1 Tax=Anguilla anguilla TaxID=7936 RepID=A0A0E9XMA5_ANGAN